MANKSKTKDGSVNLLDLFFYLLSYWYWFLLALVICVGVALYKYEKSELSYNSDATVIIKNPSNTMSTTRLTETYSSLINRTTVSNEMLQLRSKHIMTEVVEKLNLNTSYKTKERLRNVELYKSTPVVAYFSAGLAESSLSLAVTPRSESEISVKLGQEPVKILALSDTLKVNGGYVTFAPNWNYGSKFFNREINISHIPALTEAKRVLSRLSVYQLSSDNKSLLGLHITDVNNDRACDILTCLIDTYNDFTIREKNELVALTDEFIQERINSIAHDLGIVERQVESFKLRNNVMSVSDAANQYLSEGRSANNAVIAIETRIKLAEYIKEYVLDDSNMHSMIPVNAGVSDAKVEGLVSQYNNSILHRNELLLESSEENPVIKGIDNSLNAMRRSIVSTIDNAIASMEMEKRDAQIQEGAAMTKFRQMPQAASEMVTIERQQNIKESIYTFLLNKREENAISSTMIDTNARIIDVPEGSVIPIAPSRKKMVLLGILLGLFIPALILLGRLIVDTKVYSRKEIEDNCDMPFLGEIPEYKPGKKAARKDGKEGRLFYKGGNSGLLTESFRILCTNIDMMRPQNATGGQVVTVSSFDVGYGKSFVLVNAAACYADNGKKVVIVDMDLRKRSLSRSFRIGHKVQGVSNYLYDEALTLDDVLKKDVIKGVDMVPAGMVPPNPVELLRRPRLEELVNRLKDMYDFVLLDNVPVDFVADPVIINRVVDTTVFVVRSGKLERAMLPLIDELYHENKFNNIGLVLNGSPIKKRRGYSYGYGYGYSYGYGEDTPKD